MRRRDLLSAPVGMLLSPQVFPAQREAKLQFPADFAWGVSTSALQIEGALEADGRGPSIWDDIKGGKPLLGPDSAADHYRHWREDLGLLQQLGVTAYRFSVAWPRVIPDGKGQINANGLDFYDRLVDALLAAGIAPWVCLHHWDMPVAVQREAGWIRRTRVDSFMNYARAVVARLGDRVRCWIPLNEPNVVAYGGYGAGVFPPKFLNEEFFFDAVHHQNLAGARFFREFRSPTRTVGPALALKPIRSAKSSGRDEPAALLQDLVTQRAFLDPLLRGQYPEPLVARLAPIIEPGDLETIHGAADFIGVNYYGPEYRRAWTGAPFSNNGDILPEGIEETGAHIAISPEGLTEVLNMLRNEYGNPPVVITENGAAFSDQKEDRRILDLRRVAYLRDHLGAAHRALANGCDLKGYFVWSLLDNWEWTSGYDQRYGLVYVDFETQERTLKESFHWYSNVIRSGSVAGD